MKIAHYLNQFFAGIGGGDAAQHPPVRIEGAAGPGRGLRLDVAYTLSCGDDYFGEREPEALVELLALLEADPPDVLLCGPAFGSGRYGYACGSLGRQAALHGFPTVTAMDRENPGVHAAGGFVHIVETGTGLAEMRSLLPKLADVIECLHTGGDLDQAGVDLLPGKRRMNRRASQGGGKRAVDMLLGKLAGLSETEIQPPPPRPDMAVSAVTDLTEIKLGLVTESGCVPRGNPDRLPSHGARTWHRYDIGGQNTLAPDGYEVVHAGFETSIAGADPNRLVPLDALRALEAAGRFRELDDGMYVTVGNNTSVAMATVMGREMAAELKESGVSAIVLTGT